MSKAYVIYAPDGDSYFYEKADASCFCKSCGSLLKNVEYTPEKISYKKKKFDFFSTYDGQMIFNEKSKGFLNQLNIDGLNFKCVDAQQKLYILEIEKTLSIDKERRKVKFENFCKDCNDYAEIAGAIPAFLKENSDGIEDVGIYKSDVFFGSGREKSPLLFVGEGLKNSLRKSFKELDFHLCFCNDEEFVKK